MKEATKQLGIRIPASQYLSLQEIARSNNTTLTDLVISVFDEYLDKSTPGLCPLCRTQNLPDAQYCQKCGQPLTEDAATKQQMLDGIIQDENAFFEIVQEYLKRKGMHIEKVE